MTATETVELALKWDVVALKRLGLRRDVRARKEELMLVANSSTLIQPLAAN
jgi:hypothetical protein